MRGANVRITSIETRLYRFPPHRKITDAIQAFEDMEVVAATIRTDDGYEGMGFTYTIGRGGRATKHLLDTEIVPLVLGEDSFNIERIWEKVWWKLHWVGRQGIASLATSAVDIALWDLKARAFDQPLYKLLGGFRDRIPAYNTDSGWLNHTEDELVREAVGLVEQGFGGVKVKVGKDDRIEDVKRLRAVRKAVGDTVKIMVDANMRWTAAEAIARGKLFEEFDLYWYEEPIEADDVSAHALLRESVQTPIAVGESLYNRYAFKEYVAQQAASILQPDVGRVGGVTEWMRIANMAQSFNMPVAPHFLMELHVHLASAIPNALFVEHIPFLDRFLVHPLKVNQGFFEAPERPGHGVEFDEEKSRPYLMGVDTWSAGDFQTALA